LKRLLVLMSVVVLGAAGFARPLAAQPAGSQDWGSITTQERSPRSPKDSTRARVVTRADGTAAQIASVVCTLVPLGAGLALQNEFGGVLGVTGVLVGPSVGYFVGGHPVRGVQGALARAGLTSLGVVLLGTGIVQAMSYGNEEVGAAAVVASGVVGLVVVGSSIYDMVTVRATVERHAREGARVRLQGMQAPGSGAPALALTLTF